MKSPLTILLSSICIVVFPNIKYETNKGVLRRDINTGVVNTRDVETMNTRDSLRKFISGKYALTFSGAFALNLLSPVFGCRIDVALVATFAIWCFMLSCSDPWVWIYESFHRQTPPTISRPILMTGLRFSWVLFLKFDTLSCTLAISALFWMLAIITLKHPIALYVKWRRVNALLNGMATGSGGCYVAKLPVGKSEDQSFPLNTIWIGGERYDYSHDYSHDSLVVTKTSDIPIPILYGMSLEMEKSVHFDNPNPNKDNVWVMSAPISLKQYESVSLEASNFLHCSIIELI